MRDGEGGTEREGGRDGEGRREGEGFRDLEAVAKGADGAAPSPGRRRRRRNRCRRFGRRCLSLSGPPAPDRSVALAAHAAAAAHACCASAPQQVPPPSQAANSGDGLLRRRRRLRRLESGSRGAIGGDAFYSLGLCQGSLAAASQRGARAGRGTGRRRRRERWVSLTHLPEASTVGSPRRVPLGQ